MFEFGVSVDQPTTEVSQLVVILGVDSHSYESGNIFGYECKPMLTIFLFDEFFFIPDANHNTISG